MRAKIVDSNGVELTAEQLAILLSDGSTQGGMNGVAALCAGHPGSGSIYPNAMPSGVGSSSPINVRIESGITGTRKRITFDESERIRAVKIKAYHDASYTTIDGEDYLMAVVNAPDTASSDSLLNSGDINISSPDDNWPVLFIKAGESEVFGYHDDDIFITSVDFISGDSGGTGTISYGAWVGGYA